MSENNEVSLNPELLHLINYLNCHFHAASKFCAHSGKLAIYSEENCVGKSLLDSHR